MDELLFIVNEDPDGGHTARAVGDGIFTQGETRDEVVANIRDSVRVHFDEPGRVPRLLHLHDAHNPVLAL